MKTRVLVAVLTAGVCVSLATSVRAALPVKVIVTTEGPEEEVFVAMRQALAKSVPTATVSATLKQYDDYIDRRITEKQAVTLYPVILSEFIRMAHAAHWTSTDIAAFMIYLQEEIDTEGRSPTLLLQHVAQELKSGRSREEIQKNLERTEGETH